MMYICQKLRKLIESKQSYYRLTLYIFQLEISYILYVCQKIIIYYLLLFFITTLWWIKMNI